MKNDQQRIHKSVLVLSQFLNKSMSPDMVRMFCSAIGDISAEDLDRAIAQHLRGPNGRFFPSPGDLLAILNPTHTLQEAANECLGRIVTAVAKFGYNDPAGAREYLGELVWSALPGGVGWREFCMSGDPSSGQPVTTARAQLRDRLTAKLRVAFPTGAVCLPPPKEPEFKVFIPAQDEPPTLEEESRVRLLEQARLLASGEATEENNDTNGGGND